MISRSYGNIKFLIKDRTNIIRAITVNSKRYNSDGFYLLDAKHMNKPYAADESHVTTSTGKSPTSPSEKSDNNVSGDVETNARRVIRGDFGNGQERKDKLGSSYSEIQGKVNEMYRQGIVN